MALVGVEHLGRRRAGQPAVRPDRTHAADPGQHLLGHPVLAGAAVQLVGDLPLGGLVLLDVGVEQEQRHPPDLDLPDLGPQRAAAGDGEGDLHRRAVGLAQERQRQAVRVDRRVELLLPAVPGQPLGEVAGPVEQADADDRDAEVAGRLEVVAGQDAEATGVLREDLGQAELHGEVGDAARHPGLLLVPARLGQVVGQVVGGVGEPAQEPLVPGQRGQPGRRYRAEQPDRVAAALPPQLGIDGREQVQRLLVPGPTQVHDKVAQGGQLRGQGRPHGEASKCSHERRGYGSAATARGRNPPARPPELRPARRCRTRGSCGRSWPATCPVPWPP